MVDEPYLLVEPFREQQDFQTRDSNTRLIIWGSSGVVFEIVGF